MLLISRHISLSLAGFAPAQSPHHQLKHEESSRIHRDTPQHAHSVAPIERFNPIVLSLVEAVNEPFVFSVVEVVGLD